MQKIKLAICMEDAEYQTRFTNYLFGHYKEQFELHGYVSLPQFLEHAGNSKEQVLLTDERVDRKSLNWDGTIICLTGDDVREDAEQDQRMLWVEKYQDAEKIVDNILRSVDEEIYDVKSNGALTAKQKTIAVYSLAEAEYQLPFVLTMASILGESKKTLVLDLQENSGLRQMYDEGENQGLEELMVMAKGGKFSKNRLLSCICHKENWDYVYPAIDTECICSMDSEIYFKILELICRELRYEIILVNLGTRFLGFFDALEESRSVFFIKKQSGLSQGREDEFERELKQRGCHEILEKTIKMEIPFCSSQVIPCERLVDEWKWNEFGDRIRRIVLGVAQVG